MNRTLIATAVLVLLALAAPIGPGSVVLPVHAQDDGGDSQSDDGGDQIGTADPAPLPPADPAPAPADGAAVVCMEGEPCPAVVCTEGKACFKGLTMGGPIKQDAQTNYSLK